MFFAAFTLHVVVKMPVVIRSYRARGVLKPLRDDLGHTRPEPADDAEARGHAHVVQCAGGVEEAEGLGLVADPVECQLKAWAGGKGMARTSP